MANNNYFTVNSMAQNVADNKLKAKAERMFRREIYNAHKKLFFEDDGETLKEEAIICIADWSKAAKINKTQIFQPDHILRGYEGMRALLMHIMSRFEMDEAKFADLRKHMED